MPAPKDPEERKIWIENIREARLGTHLSEKTKEKLREVNLGEKNPMFGRKRPDTAEWNRQRSGKLSPNYGKHPSQETRDKLSKALIGRVFSQETRSKMSKTRIGKYTGEKNPMFGRTGENCPAFGRTGEKHPMFGKIGYWHGKKRPDQTKRMRREGNPMFGKPNPAAAERNRQRSGEKSPTYIDGRSYEPYTSAFTRQLKELIRLRDGYKCRKCGCPEIEERKKLAIHHIDYDKKNCLPDNLITLCLRCNAEVNKDRKKWTKYFQKGIGREYQSQLCLSIL